MTTITLTQELGGNDKGSIIDVAPGVATQLVDGGYAELVDGPNVTDDGATKPAKNGSLEAWTRYAQSLDLTVPDDAKRDDIVALVEAHEAN